MPVIDGSPGEHWAPGRLYSAKAGEAGTDALRFVERRHDHGHGSVGDLFGMRRRRGAAPTSRQEARGEDDEREQLRAQQHSDYHRICISRSTWREYERVMPATSWVLHES